MATLNKGDVLHIAKLAKLDIKNSEVGKYSEQLSKVVDYIKELGEVDTEGVEPTSQTTGLNNIFRNDEIDVQNCLSQDEAVSGTDNVHNGYFKVPAILSERTDK
jgi:aspartyl-tRNA(Asn)/glutamyl-tRNA(Gln) amidotransferase subunit C